MEMTFVHIDRQTKTIDGVTFTNTHSGQKKAYGDTFYEYDVKSDLPPADVEKVCREQVYPAIPKSEWLADYRTPGCSMENAFRPHFEFRQLGPDRFFYVVTILYAD